MMVSAVVSIMSRNMLDSSIGIIVGDPPEQTRADQGTNTGPALGDPEYKHQSTGITVGDPEYKHQSTGITVGDPPELVPWNRDG
jgi:hypothetical protein